MYLNQRRTRDEMRAAPDFSTMIRDLAHTQEEFSSSAKPARLSRQDFAAAIRTVCAIVTPYGVIASCSPPTQGDRRFVV
jgi:hypothetical protein